MCDEGRFDFAYVNDKNRLQRPLFQGQPTDWEKLMPALRSDLAAAGKRHGAGLAAVLSPMLTCEEAYLLAKAIKGFSAEAKLYLGWVPIVGQDDHYPQDRRGRPLPPIKFTIRAEKCPNRRGVEEILKHFQGDVLSFDKMLDAAGAGEIQTLVLTAGYSPRLGPWVNEPQALALSKVPLLVVQDLFAS